MSYKLFQFPPTLNPSSSFVLFFLIFRLLVMYPFFEKALFDFPEDVSFPTLQSYNIPYFFIARVPILSSIFFTKL